ncbi:MFS transporter [Sporolactobacillus kofuensis]|uniref:MFS transporter n=1 Tax=Sporolactobacillus kofuensis TaxID=269672 RepID=A0ABW1WH68_9BACL|nr:MFS transporter [Sporolactobacillus kofuensis]MCO7177076.1 MFS transporter [Sporolactobacillus kofuensis]
MMKRSRFWYSAILFIGFLVLLVSSGVRAFPSTLVLPWQQDFGWSRGGISAVIATGTLLFGLIGPFSAAFLQRYGARRIGCVALLILALVTFALPFMKTIWQAEILVGLISGTMTGAVADVYGIYIANNWFSKNRGLVLGLFTASSSVGQLIVLPILAGMIDTQGWHQTALAVAVFIVVVLLMIFLLMRDYPHQVGLSPFGSRVQVTPVYPKINVQAVLLQPLQALRNAAKSNVFWLLALPFFVCGASTSGLIGVHFIAAGHDYGMSEVKVSNIMALMGIFDIIGSLIAGLLTEKFDSRYILMTMYGLRGLDLFLLPIALTQGGTLLIFYAIIFGFSWNATVSPTIKLIADNFGIEKSGMLFGWVFVLHQIGGALMAYTSGAMHDMVHNYVIAFGMAGVICLVAALMVIIVPKPTK